MRNVLVLLAICLVAVGCSKKEDITAISNNELNDLQVLVEVSEYFYANPSIEKPIVKKVDGMVYGAIVSARALQPTISKLNAASLKGLCAAVVLSRNPSFGSAVNDPQLTQLVKNYLTSIEPLLKEHTNELKKTIFTDRDCAI